MTCRRSSTKSSVSDGSRVSSKLVAIQWSYHSVTRFTDVIHSPSYEFAHVMARHRCLLAKLADISPIRLEKTTAAQITLDFAPPPLPKISYDKPRWANQYILTVTIDAKGKPADIAHYAGLKGAAAIFPRRNAADDRDVNFSVS